MPLKGCHLLRRAHRSGLGLLTTKSSQAEACATKGTAGLTRCTPCVESSPLSYRLENVGS
jgi:hypothetical protein